MTGVQTCALPIFRDLIKALAKKGITIIIASHLLDEVEKICTHVAILKRGTLITSGPVNEVLSNEDIVEIAAADMEQLKSCIAEMGGFTLIKEENERLQIHYPFGTSNMEMINSHCFKNGITLQLLLSKKKSLESTFFELTND